MTDTQGTEPTPQPDPEWWLIGGAGGRGGIDRYLMALGTHGGDPTWTDNPARAMVFHRPEADSLTLGEGALFRGHRVVAKAQAIADQDEWVVRLADGGHFGADGRFVGGGDQFIAPAGTSPMPPPLDEWTDDPRLARRFTHRTADELVATAPMRLAAVRLDTIDVS